MEVDLQKVRLNILKAETDDLLDRVTAFRAGMEPEAVDLIEAELIRRGVTWTEIDAYREMCERECLYFADGTAMTCSLCRKPAVETAWGWHKLFRSVPIFPMRYRHCRDHAHAQSP